MKKKLFANTTISLLYQIITVIVGLILPRIILLKFGSSVNGLVQSITQMLSVVAMLDLGVGAVVQVALYGPLSTHDQKRISLIYQAAKKYFRVIARIILCYIVLLCIYYALYKSEAFSPAYSILLILAISISQFAQYYFGITNQLLLNADQKVYIGTSISICTTLLNAVLTILLIKLNASIQLVKLVSSLVFLIKPVILQIYVNKNYSISNEEATEDVLPQKWNGLAQHITTIVTNSIDNVLLTLFSTFENISIYNVYVMPLNAFRNLMEVTSTGIKSYFGNLLVTQDIVTVRKKFNIYESICHYIISIIFGTIILTLVPFVLVYTKGVNDIEYKQVVFSIVITLAYMLYTMRVPYSNIIFSAGKFKETQSYCIIECAINIVISFVLIFRFGIVGIAFGTCVSSLYRTFTSAYYLKSNIIFLDWKRFIIHFCIDIIGVLIILMLSFSFSINANSFGEWIIHAFISFCICLFISTLINVIYIKDIMQTLVYAIKKQN